MADLTPILARFREDGAKIYESIVRLRRKFHQNPETGNEEFETTKVLKEELSSLGLKIYDKQLPTGLWAELDTGKRGPTIALRTDIDALPITEQSGLPFASKNPGKMHACGHDVHMAILVGAARLLASQKDQLRGRVRFICQPAEEIPPGGARPLIKAGVLRKPPVDAILALHVDSGLPTGTIGLRDGPSMASVYDFDIAVVGKSGHAALPHHTVDAIAVAAEIITGLQQVVSRMVDPVQPVVLTFGTIRGGEVRNVVAGEVTIQGTARCLDAKLTERLPRQIKKTATEIGRAFGAVVKVQSVSDYPVLASDPVVNKHIYNSYQAVFPNGKAVRVPEVMGGEDFAVYLEKVPGAMFRLGVGNKDIGADKPWHHQAFIVDEAAIPIGYTVFASAVAHLLYNWESPGRKKTPAAEKTATPKPKGRKNPRSRRHRSGRRRSPSSRTQKNS